MLRAFALGLAGLVGALSLTAALAKPPPYVPPPETARLADGSDVDLVDANCSACHSVDFITTQPRRLADPKAFWTAEVTKMRKAFGYQTTDETAARIVSYLSETYK